MEKVDTIMTPLTKGIDDIISPSYLVGGSVRDLLLGREPKDYDYCTPLLPDDIEQKVKDAGKRAFITGKRFGTIGFKKDGEFVEVTTFRTEVYGKTRKPEVEFVTSLQEDLSRRDFTINAIALKGKKIVDPFGGREDLDNKLIKCVGNSTLRFKEDPLRMLRAVRFVSQLGFSIDKATHKSITKNAHLITTVSRERWGQELDKILTGEYVSKALYNLLDTDLIKFILPELRLQVGFNQNSRYHNLSLIEHTIETVANVDNNIELRWGALLHDIGKPFTVTHNNSGFNNYVFHDKIGADLVYGIGKRLKWSNERIKTVSELVKNHLSDDSPIREADNLSKEEQL